MVALSAGGGLSLIVLALRASLQGRWLQLPAGDGRRIRKLLISSLWALLALVVIAMALHGITELSGEPSDALKALLGLATLGIPVAVFTLGLLGKLPGTRSKG